MIGAYYYDGWTTAIPQQWNPVTKRMRDEFSGREPVWGWSDDSIEIMERQIDLAADHGVAFFAFCWFCYDNKQAINEKNIMESPLHDSLNLFLKAKNNHRMKFCLMVANHQGYEIDGAANWKNAGDLWVRNYLKNELYLTVGGKPLIIVFNHGGGDKDGFAAMQETARSAGLPGLAIAGCAGGDQAVGYTHRTHYNVIPGYDAGSEEHKYSDLVAAHQEQWKGSTAQPYIPIVAAGWDKRPLEGPEGVNQKPGWFFPDRTPERFANSLQDAIGWMDKHPDQTTEDRLVMVYAWNELGEGGYLVPTKDDPDGKYLKALKSVVMPTTQTGQPLTPADKLPR